MWAAGSHGSAAGQGSGTAGLTFPDARLSGSDSYSFRGVEHVKERAVQSELLHWLLQEPVVYGRPFDYRAWILTSESVVNIAGPKLDNDAARAAGLGVRSVSIISKLLEH